MEKIENKRANKLIGVISVYDDLVLYHHNNIKTNELSAGKLLTKDSMKKIFKFLNSDSDMGSFTFSGMVPENILKYNMENGDMVFYTKPQRRIMLFKTEAIKSDEFTIPYVLWVYKNGSLSVYALKKKPTKETDVLYMAPFFNTSSNGAVCMGNVYFKNRTGKIDGFSDQLQELFFNSVFTHTNNNELATENIIELYEKAKSKDFVWDNYLLKTKLTLKDVL